MMTPHNGVLLAILTSVIYVAILYGRYRGRADAWAKGHKYWNRAYSSGWDNGVRQTRAGLRPFIYADRVPAGTTPPSPTTVWGGRHGSNCSCEICRDYRAGRG